MASPNIGSRCSAGGQKTSPAANPPIALEHTVTELTGLVFKAGDTGENDLMQQGEGMPIGERIDVHGRVLDEDGRPFAGALVEMWQANAAGR